MRSEHPAFGAPSCRGYDSGPIFIQVALEPIELAQQLRHLLGAPVAEQLLDVRTEEIDRLISDRLSLGREREPFHPMVVRVRPGIQIACRHQRLDGLGDGRLRQLHGASEPGHGLTLLAPQHKMVEQRELRHRQIYCLEVTARKMDRQLTMRNPVSAFPASCIIGASAFHDQFIEVSSGRRRHAMSVTESEQHLHMPRLTCSDRRQERLLQGLQFRIFLQQLADRMDGHAQRCSLKVQPDVDFAAFDLPSAAVVRTDQPTERGCGLDPPLRIVDTALVSQGAGRHGFFGRHQTEQLRQAA